MRTQIHRGIDHHASDSPSPFFNGVKISAMEDIVDFEKRYIRKRKEYLEQKPPTAEGLLNTKAILEALGVDDMDYTEDDLSDLDKAYKLLLRAVDRAKEQNEGKSLMTEEFREAVNNWCYNCAISPYNKNCPEKYRVAKN